MATLDCSLFPTVVRLEADWTTACTSLYAELEMGDQIRSGLTFSIDLSLTFMYSFQMAISHPTVTDVNITCVT